MKVRLFIKEAVRKVSSYFFHHVIVNNYSKFQRTYWEVFWRMENRCESDDDLNIISKIIDKYQPTSILDAGCGSGRLFGLYRQKGIKDVIGVDISVKALKMANKRSPEIKTIRSRLEDLNFESKRFDLTISSRALEHIPRESIASTIEKICFISKLIYINELTSSDSQTWLLFGEKIMDEEVRNS